MRILVLGGTGFIGSHIVDALLQNGHYVKVLDRTLKYTFQETSNNIEYIQADFGDTSVLFEALTGIDVVIHLISSTVPSTSNLDPVADIKVNLVNSVNLLQAMVKTGVRRIIYFSSGGTIYGRPDVLPIPESHSKQPLCSYGINKLAVENYLYMYQELYGVEPIILRVSNPYGPRQGHLGSQGVIGTFLNQIMNKQNIRIWGDGSIVRDYIYIADVVSACMATLNLEQGGVFNIGSGQGYSLLDIIKEIERCTETDAEVIFEPSRGFDIKTVVLDTSLAREVLDWSPEFSLKQGMALHCNWLAKSIHSSE